jgi:hypothetical protein
MTSTKAMGKHMSRPLRIGGQLWPGGAPDYQSWRSAVLHAEDIGADMILGYDAGATTFTTEIHPTDEGYDFSVLTEMLARRDAQR